MLVKQLLQNAEGKQVTFEADLSEQEFAYIFNTGLNFLLARGAIPPEYVKEESVINLETN